MLVNVNAQIEKAKERDAKEAAKEDARCRAAIDDTIKLCAALVQLDSDMAALDGRYLALTDKLRRIGMAIEALGAHVDPLSTSIELSAALDVRKLQLNEELRKTTDTAKLVADGDKELGKGRGTLSDYRARLAKLEAHQFTGPLYSEIEPELVSARAACETTDRRVAATDASGKATHEMLDQVRRVERDVRQADTKRERDIKKVQKDEVDCDRLSQQYWQRAADLRDEAAQVSVRLATLAVEVPSLTRRFHSLGEQFDENHRELQRIEEDTTLEDPAAAVDAAMQLVEQRKRRADDVKRRAAEIAAQATACEKELAKHQAAVAAARRDKERLDASQTQLLSQIADLTGIMSATRQASQYIEHQNLRVVLPDLSPLQLQRVPALELALTELKEQLNDVHEHVNVADQTRVAVREAEKGIRMRDKNIRGQAKKDEKSVKVIQRQQTEQKLQRAKEQEKAEKERQRDETALGQARDETQRLHQALLAAQKDLVSLQASGTESERQFEALLERTGALDAQRAPPGRIDAIARACTDKLAQLEDQKQRSGVVATALQQHQKDVAKMRDSVLALRQKHAKLDSLQRPELRPQLAQLGQLVGAAAQWCERLDAKCGDLRALEAAVRERLRTALGNARDNERALKRMAGAEQDCSVAHRAITVSIGSAGDAARNMCRAVHTTNAALPATDDHITVLGNEFARELQAYDALLAEVPDESSSVDAQLAWLEAKKLRLADRKRSLTELSARLALLDRDVARHREQQSTYVRDLNALETGTLAELTARVSELRGSSYTLQQWAASYVERNVTVELPNVDELEARLAELKAFVAGAAHEAVDALAASCSRLEARSGDVQQIERSTKERDAAVRESDKQLTRELKRMAKAQNEAERQKIKEEEKALRAAQRDADALSNATDDAIKLANAYTVMHDDLALIERTVANAIAAFSTSCIAVAALEPPRRTSGNADELLADNAAVRAELDATLRGAQEAASALTSAEKDMARVREMTSKLYPRLQRLESLGRTEMATNLQAVRASHEATLERQNAADGRRREARDEERRYRSLDSNARESSRLAERALRRVLQAEEDAARQQRQEDDVFGQASGEARNLGRRVQAFNGELPMVEVHIAELADAQNQLQEHLRVLDRDPDDRLPLDRQLADVAEERVAALNEAKRSIGDLSKRLNGCERELATTTANVNAALVELGRLQSQSLPVLLSELSDLRSRIDTTRDWANDFGGGDVACVARLPDARAAELEQKLVPELQQYALQLGQAMDGVSTFVARLANDVKQRSDAERRLKQSEVAAREHMKAKTRELKRLLKARNAAEIAKIKEEERLLAAQQTLADGADGIRDEAQKLVVESRTKLSEIQAAHASALSHAADYAAVRELLAAVDAEQAAARRQMPGQGAAGAAGSTSDSMWSAIDQRRDTLNGAKRRAAALTDRLVSMVKQVKQFANDAAALQNTASQSRAQLHQLRERALSYPQSPSVATALATADQVETELREALRVLDELARAGTALKATVSALQEADAAIYTADANLREADAQSERALRGIAKKQAQLDKTRMHDQAVAANQRARPSGAAPGGRQQSSNGLGPVFGVHLAELEVRAVRAHTGSGPIPMLDIVDAPLVWIEQNAMHVEGLFRLSGDKNTIDRMRAEFDAGRVPPFGPTTNPHDVAGVFKMWLRELPEPLLTFDGYPHFLYHRGDANALRGLIGKLPAANRTVLLHIVGFLVKFMRYEAQTKMGAKNLGVVFGPPFLRAPGNDPLAEMNDMGAVLECTQTMLAQPQAVFGISPNLNTSPAPQHQQQLQQAASSVNLPQQQQQQQHQQQQQQQSATAIDVVRRTAVAAAECWHDFARRDAAAHCGLGARRRPAHGASTAAVRAGRVCAATAGAAACARAGAADESTRRRRRRAAAARRTRGAARHRHRDRSVGGAVDDRAAL
jgi:chromosome segregation ATPase